MSNRCRTCRFFQVIKLPGEGQCRRYALRGPVKSQKYDDNQWPPVTTNDWCGEYEADATDRKLAAQETELDQLRRSGLTDEQREALYRFKKTGKATDLALSGMGALEGQNAQATEVKFRMVKDVNRGLRTGIKNIAVNMAYARTLKPGSNERGEIEDFTLREALAFTDLGGLAQAARLGKEALKRPPEERGFEKEDTDAKT